MAAGLENLWLSKTVNFMSWCKVATTKSQTSTGTITDNKNRGFSYSSQFEKI